MPTPPLIVVVGSSNTDLVLTCPRLPAPGESIVGGELQRFAGGKGANQAVAAARAGARVAFVGGRGNDEFGKQSAAGLKAEGIDIRHFKTLPGVASGTALILIGGKERQNLIGVANGANDRVTTAHVEAASSLIGRASILVAQLEVPLDAVLKAAQLAADANIPFILNPAPARKCPKELLQLTTYVTPNEHEALVLTGKSDPREAAKALLGKGVRHVIVTLGAQGALWLTRNAAPVHVPAPKVKPVDTVGAGDCFNGWLATGLAEGLPVQAAMEQAVRAASIAVTRPGAQSGMPQRNEVVG